MDIYQANWSLPNLATIQCPCPLILIASCMSFGMMVTLLAWMAQRLVSSKRLTRYASAPSCRAEVKRPFKNDNLQGGERANLDAERIGILLHKTPGQAL